MTPKTSIIFYDMASDQPLRTFAANPWKTRLALNFVSSKVEDFSYRTEWVDLPDISSLRQGLDVPANRTLPDGTPFHTLPMIRTVDSEEVIGDSFEIALYLENIYGSGLFRPLTVGLTAAFNAHIDSLFTNYVLLVDRMPFDSRIQDEVTVIFAQRASMMGIKDLQLSDGQREQMFVAFETALGELAKAYYHAGATTDHVWLPNGTNQAQAQRPGRQVAGPFLDGERPAYADFIVGAWLKMMEASMRPEDWQRVKTWQGGLWERVTNALAPWSETQ